jgi:hypothetical protein
VQWHISVITVFGKQRKEDLQFQASLGYIVRSCPKKKKKRKENNKS